MLANLTTLASLRWTQANPQMQASPMTLANLLTPAPTTRAPCPRTRALRMRARHPRMPAPTLTPAPVMLAPMPTPEPQTPEPQTPEPQTPEPQTPEPQTLEPQTPEPQTLEPQTLEPQTLAPTEAAESMASTPPSRAIALIGGAGLVGRALTQLLLHQGHSVRIVDRVPLSLPGALAASAVAQHTVDLTTVTPQQLAACIDGCDAMVHLAAQVNPPRPTWRQRRRGQSPRDQMRRLHEQGTRVSVQAAALAGVPRFVLVSSAVVYGARADNPVPLTEQEPLRPQDGFPYGQDKRLQERVLDDERPPSLSTATLRPAIIYSKHTDNYLSQMLRLAPGVLPAVDGHRPPLQFVHTDDVADALARLALSTAEGAFNLGGAPIAYDEVARLAGLRVVDMPRKMLAPLLDVGARLVPGKLRAPSYVLDQLAYPFVVSSVRAVKALGVQPRPSSEALVEMLRK